MPRKSKKTRRKVIDPFSKKEWYEIRAPHPFANQKVGWTLVNRTVGTKIASDFLKGRVFETNLADLQKDEDQAYRKIRLRCEDVHGRQLLTQFLGMDFTTDKLRSLVRKWQTLIEAFVDVKTTDGYVLRLFAIAFTRRRPNQVKRTAYAQTAQIRQIRAKMVEIMQRESASCELKDLVAKFIPESIGRRIEKECQGIYPLKDCYVRKVKVLKKPKYDPYKLMELFNDDDDDVGVAVDDDGEPKADPLGVGEAGEDEVVGDDA